MKLKICLTVLSLGAIQAQAAVICLNFAEADNNAVFNAGDPAGPLNTDGAYWNSSSTATGFANGTINGLPFVAQVERGNGKNPLALRVQNNGRAVDVLVVSPRMAELHKLMPHKAPPDMSKFVLSPMPGLLVQINVEPGQKVQAGERVATIEAMKMENALFAAADGVVKSVSAKKGDSLVVDQPIVEFE